MTMLAYTKEQVLDAIAYVESGNKAIGVHPDGVSFGRHGVTYGAVKELRRVNILKTIWVDLREDRANRRIAAKYLELMRQ